VAIIRFYFDAQIPKQVAIQLRARGVDVLRCQEIGWDDKKDPEHLEYAASEKRMIVTADEDFERLHAQWQEEGKFHAGIAQVAHESQHAVGVMVKELWYLVEAIENEAASLEKDIYNQIYRIKG
jgi:predicted nuclease of predicted toxin-antitoxin system